MLEILLGSKLRAKVLGWLFNHPDERYFVRQLTVLVHDDSTNVSRELARLEKTGILISTTEGKQKYYQANRKSPIFDDLHGLMVKTAGLTDVKKPLDMVEQRFRVPPEKLAEFCRKHHIKKLALFGSVLREDFRPDSDVDVLVEFDPGHVPGFAMIDIGDELSRLVRRKVDLRTPNDLSRYFRDRVVREARVEYVGKKS
jgi:predicted nucleotidyltransferase